MLSQSETNSWIQPVKPAPNDQIETIETKASDIWRFLQDRYLSLDLSPSSSGRIYLIDTMRGLLLYWMIVSHTIHQAGVPMDHPLQWLRPFAWMSSTFAMVTGLSLAVLFAKKPFTLKVGTSKFFVKARKLFIIAFVSNALSVAWRDKSLVAAWSATKFEAPWSISQYLLPTVLMLLLAPLLVTAAKKTKPLQLFAFLVAGIAILDGSLAFIGSKLENYKFVYAIVEGNGILNVSIINFTTASFFAFGLGSALRKNGQSNHELLTIWTTLLIGAAIFIANQSWFQLALANDSHMSFESLLAIARFILVAQMASVLCTLRQVPFFRSFNTLLDTFGRNSLLIFILHRPLIHIIGIVLSKTVKGYEPNVFIGSALTIFLMWQVCLFRKKIAGCDRFLLKIGF